MLMKGAGQLQAKRLSEIAMVIDVSKSMCQKFLGTQRKIDVAKRIINIFVELLDRKGFETTLYLVQIPSRQGSYRRVGMAPADAGLVSSTLKRLDECLPGTPLYSGLDAIVRDVGRFLSNGLIVYVGDGRTTEPVTKIMQLRDEILRFIREHGIKLAALIVDRSLASPLITVFFEQASGVPPAIITPYIAVREEYLYSRVEEFINAIVRSL